MSWQIGTVTLPKAPRRIVHQLPTVNEAFKITGGTAVAVGLGLDLETLTVNVVLHGQNYSLEQLSGSYLTPLKGYLNSGVEISFPLTFYSGTWLMTELQPNITNEAPDSVDVIIKFVRGSGIEIL